MSSAQGREWNHDVSLDWHLLEGGDNWHHGVQRLRAHLNHTYRHHKALHELDFDPTASENGWWSMTMSARCLSLYAVTGRATEIIVAGNHVGAAPRLPLRH